MLTRDDTEAEVYGFPASIRATTYTPREVEGLVARAREVALDETAVDPERLFFFRMEPSNTNLDTYYTHMMPSTLRNFAEDAARGVSFQDSHNWKQQGFGRTLTGLYHGGRSGNPSYVESDVMVPRGSNLYGFDTDTWIERARLGIAQDVSVGFYSGRFMCSICNRDMQTDWDCFHFPGISYKLKDEEEERAWRERVADILLLTVSLSNGYSAGGESIFVRKSKDEMKVLCTAAVEDGRLAETSSVYDGACPGAGLKKAMRMAAEGSLDARARFALESRYRVALPIPRSLTQIDGMKGKTMNARQDPPPGDSDLDAVRALSGLPGGDANTDEAVRLSMIRAALVEAGMAVEQVTDLTETLARLVQRDKGWDDREVALKAAREKLEEFAAAEADIQAGQEYRKALIEEVVLHGKRALDTDFDEELERRTMAGMPVADLVRKRDQNEKHARKILGGGRKSIDTPKDDKAKDVQTVDRHAWARKMDPPNVYR